MKPMCHEICKLASIAPDKCVCCIYVYETSVCLYIYMSVLHEYVRVCLCECLSLWSFFFHFSHALSPLNLESVCQCHDYSLWYWLDLFDAQATEILRNIQGPAESADSYIWTCLDSHVQMKPVSQCDSCVFLSQPLFQIVRLFLESKARTLWVSATHWLHIPATTGSLLRTCQSVASAPCRAETPTFHHVV